ncbi:MAG: glycosyltransferase [Candidatus Moranbacteria bacterium]|nr:glycosyltransferase [Candidatus Moranbacteria bacterium]
MSFKKIKNCIITPTFNNEDYTIACFSSVKKNTKDYLIIWIDNGSTPKSQARVKNFLDKNKIPYKLISNQENTGFIHATNQGIKEALKIKPKYIIFLNNDTEVYDNWLNTMSGILKKDKQLGLIGPVTSPCNSWQSIEYLKKYKEFENLPKYKHNPKQYSRLIQQQYQGEVLEVGTRLAFFCTVLKYKLVKQLGGLSTQYQMGFGEDDDYCLRAKIKGWKIALSKEIFVFHNHRTTFKSLFNQKTIDKMLEKNRQMFEQKQTQYLMQLQGRENILSVEKKNLFSRLMFDKIADSNRSFINIGKIDFFKKNKIQNFKKENFFYYLNWENFLNSKKTVAIPEKSTIRLNLQTDFIGKILTDFNKNIEVFNNFDQIFLSLKNKKRTELESLNKLFKFFINNDCDIFFIDNKKNRIFRITNNPKNWCEIIKNFAKLNFFIANKKIPNVCFISHTSVYRGGAEKSLIDLTKNLIKQDLICHIIIPQTGELEKEIRHHPISYQIIPFKKWVYFEKFKKYLNQTKIYNNIIQSSEKIKTSLCLGDFDVVYTNTSTVNAGSLAAKKTGIPHLWHIREFGDLDHNLKFLKAFADRFEFIYNNSQTVIFNSKSLKKYYLKKNNKLESKSLVCYNAIEMKDSIKIKKPFSQKKINILIPGSIQEGKGQLEGLKALNLLINKIKNKNISIKIAGGIGSQLYYEKILNYLNQNKLKNYVEILGYCKNYQQEILNQADIVLICSKNEAFGRVIAEALLFEKPVIAFKGGAAEEIITNNSTGILCKRNDFKQMSEKINFLIKNPKLGVKMGEKGAEFVRKKFNQKNYSQKIAKLIKQIFKKSTKKNKDNFIQNYILDQRNEFLAYRKKYLEYYLESIQINELRSQIIHMQSSYFWKMKLLYSKLRKKISKFL